MPKPGSPACLCTFHSMCSFALLSNLCMLGWAAASPRGTRRMIQMLWDAIMCYMMMQDADPWWCDYMIFYDDVRWWRSNDSRCCYKLLRSILPILSWTQNRTSIVICCMPSLDGLLSHCCNRAWGCPFWSPIRLPWEESCCLPANISRQIFTKLLVCTMSQYGCTSKTDGSHSWTPHFFWFFPSSSIAFFKHLLWGPNLFNASKSIPGSSMGKASFSWLDRFSSCTALKEAPGSASSLRFWGLTI